MKRTLQLITMIGLLGVCSFAGTVAPDFKVTNPFAPVNVIVVFDSAPTAALANALAGNGASIKKQYRHVSKVQVFTVPQIMVPVIAKIPGVKHITPDRTVVKHMDITDVTVGSTIANSLGWTGAGIGVAVIDSGIDVTNKDLGIAGGSASRVVYSQDFVGTGTKDFYGHGTHVAGIIGGNGANSNGLYKGIAPQVNLINLRVLDENGSGTDSAVIQAIDTAINLQQTYNIRVINLSLGRNISETFSDDPLCQAVEAAYQAGITVVVAAGNDGRDNGAGTGGYSTISAPANDPFVITVGAMKAEGTTDRTDDLMASYSSRGPSLIDHFVKPDIVAPGNLIKSLRVPGSTLDVQYPANQVAPTLYGAPANSSPLYFTLNGTSMATPVVSGTVALMLQRDPTLTPDQIKGRLMLTATKSFPASSVVIDPATGTSYTDYYDVFTVGAGYLDVMAALNSTVLPPGITPSPQAVLNANGTITIVNPNLSALDDDGSGDGGDGPPSLTQIAWDDTTAWADSAVWGASAVFSNTNVIFSSATQLLQGSNAVWNSKTAWANMTPGATSTVVKGEK